MREGDKGIVSLLKNDLNVAQLLHISLSRPLTLKTDQKDSFLLRVKEAVLESNVRAFNALVKDLSWHPNETKTRWFLVLRLEMSPQLSRLLDICNGAAKRFSQPLLYAEQRDGKNDTTGDQFHISIAWSLQQPKAHRRDVHLTESDSVQDTTGVPYALLGQWTALSIAFGAVKLRIGQDVHAIALKARRQSHG